MNKADYNIVYFRQHVVASEEHHMWSPAEAGLASGGSDCAPRPGRLRHLIPHTRPDFGTGN